MVCFDDISYPKNIQKHVWVHESTAMQMMFLNNLNPPHEEAGGEVANGDVQTSPPWLIDVGAPIPNVWLWPNVTSKHKPDVYITQKLTLRLDVHLVQANDQAWHPPPPNTSIASIIDTSEWCQWSLTNCVDVCMSRYNKVVDIPQQNNIDRPDIHHLQPPASHQSPTPVNGVDEATQIVWM